MDAMTPVTAVAWNSRDVFATGHEDGTLRTWRAPTTRQCQFNGGDARVHVKAMCYAPNGDIVAIALQDGRVGLWDAVTGVHIKSIGPPTINGIAGCLAFNPVHPTVGIGLPGSVCLWDLENDTTRRLATRLDEVEAMAFSPDGRRVATLAGTHSPDLGLLGRGAPEETHDRVPQQRLLRAAYPDTPRNRVRCIWQERHRDGAGRGHAVGFVDPGSPHDTFTIGA